MKKLLRILLTSLALVLCSTPLWSDSTTTFEEVAPLKIGTSYNCGEVLPLARFIQDHYDQRVLFVGDKDNKEQVVVFYNKEDGNFTILKIMTVYLGREADGTIHDPPVERELGCIISSGVAKINLGDALAQRRL